MGKKDKSAATPKKLNIYVVKTTIPGAEPGHPGLAHTDYVRAKTKAGAVGIVAAKYVAAELASAEDLLKLANLKPLEGAAKGGV